MAAEACGSSEVEGPADWHPDEARTVAVLSGTLYFASGERWDESKFKAYLAGTFYSELQRSPHYIWANNGDLGEQWGGHHPGHWHRRIRQNLHPTVGSGEPATLWVGQG